MQNLYPLITITFAVSLICSVFLVPFVNKLGFLWGVIDVPNQRKQHKGEIVRLGGMAIFIGYLSGILFILGISLFINDLDIDINIFKKVLISSSLFFCLGLADDFLNMKPFPRLFLQFLFASFLYAIGINFEGISIHFLDLNNNLFVLNSFFSYLITIFWIVGITNAINWLDGLDGLAAGITIISNLGMITIFIFSSQLEYVLLSSVIIGSSIGFLRYNFYPAKILMGDGGSYLLGSLLGTTSILGLSRNFEQFELINFFPLEIAILLMIVPILDMISVMIERLVNGFSIFYPDRRHLHHKLLRFGIHPRSVVIIIYAISQTFVFLALSSLFKTLNLAFISSCFILTIFSLLYCINFKNNFK